MLVRETYSKKEVAQFLAKGFVPIKIDAEKGKGPELAKRYGVSGFPTLVLIDPKGEEVDRLVGYRPPQKFLAELQPIVEGKSFGALKKKAETDLEAAVALGKKYEERSDFPKAAEIYGRVLQSSTASAALREAAEGRMAIVGYYRSKGKEIAGVEKFFRDHAKSDGARDQASVVFGHYQGTKGGDPAKVIEAGDYLSAHGSKEDSEFLNNYGGGDAEAGGGVRGGEGTSAVQDPPGAVRGGAREVGGQGEEALRKFAIKALRRMMDLIVQAQVRAPAFRHLSMACVARSGLFFSSLARR